MESDFIHWLRGRLPDHPKLLLGPGDDAAVVQLAASGQAVVTTDMLTEGVDFILSEVTPERVGRKALAVNLSDLAAMAARPLAAQIALALPRSGGLALAQRLYEGLIPLAEEFELATSGGDTNSWDGPLVISITLFGEPTAAGVLTRRGAQPGDAIVVTGRFGGSILAHQFDFQPRVREALWLKQNSPLHAGIDVSDGLSLDLARLAAESGCAAELVPHQVPCSDDAMALASDRADGSTALEHALSDGEDFELILALPADAADDLIARQPLECGLTRIGQFAAGQGLWQIDPDGHRRPLLPRGFEHRLA